MSAIAALWNPLTPAQIAARLGSSAISFKDSLFSLKDDGDATKVGQFQLSGLTTATTRTWTMPDASTTLAGLSVAQTWTAAQTIDISALAGAVPVPIYATGSPLIMVGAVTNILEGVAWSGQGYRMIGRLAGGSRGADAATANNGVFFTLQAYGHNGTSWQTSPNAVWAMAADGLWSGASRGAYHYWQATPNGSTTATEWMRLQGANLLIGTTTNISGTGGLSVAGTTAATSTTSGAFQCAGGAGIAGALCLSGTSGASLRIATPAANAAIATTLGSVGPTGSTAGNPQGWLRISVAGTDRFIPFW